MNASITVRNFAQEGVAEAVLEIWTRARINRSWLDLRQEIHEKLARDPSLFLVATKGGRIVGAVMGAYDGRRGWVYHLAVEPKYQRVGIGRLLMQRVEDEMRRLGIRKVNLQVRHDNEHVLEFYEGIGYADQNLRTLAKWLRE